MCYAVMYKKPIIFYTTEEINSSHDAYHVNFLSQVLGSKLINIDKKKILIVNLQIKIYLRLILLNIKNSSMTTYVILNQTKEQIIKKNN